MAIMEAPLSKVEMFDDFLGDTLNGDLYVATASTSGTAAITDVEIDGTVQLDTDATSGDAAQLAGNLNWRVQDGSLRLEARVKYSSASDIGTFVGFSDATNETDIIPITLSGTTWTTTATTAIGFVYNTAATTDIIYCMWVDDDSDATQSLSTLGFTGLLPIADEYYTYILELQDNGSGNQVSCRFTVIDSNGREYQKQFDSTIDRDAVLCPYIGHENNGSAAKETTMDYWRTTKSRAATID